MYTALNNCTFTINMLFLNRNINKEIFYEISKSK